MRIFYFLSLLICATLISCGSTNSEDNLLVIVKYKTQPNKNIDAIVALKALVEQAEKEDHFVELKIYVDPDDNSIILVQEEWEDASYYKNDHMKTAHYQKFMTDSPAFLVGTPEISYWNLNSAYRK